MESNRESVEGSKPGSNISPSYINDHHPIHSLSSGRFQHPFSSPKQAAASSTSRDVFEYRDRSSQSHSILNPPNEFNLQMAPQTLEQELCMLDNLWQEAAGLEHQRSEPSIEIISRPSEEFRQIQLVETPRIEEDNPVIQEESDEQTNSKEQSSLQNSRRLYTIFSQPFASEAISQHSEEEEDDGPEK